MGRYGHSEERPKVEPLFAMTISQNCYRRSTSLHYTTFYPKSQDIMVKHKTHLAAGGGFSQPHENQSSRFLCLCPPFFLNPLIFFREPKGQTKRNEKELEPAGFFSTPRKSV